MLQDIKRRDRQRPIPRSPLINRSLSYRRIYTLIVPSEGVGLQVVMFPIPKDKKECCASYGLPIALEVRYPDETGYETTRWHKECGQACQAVLQLLLMMRRRHTRQIVGAQTCSSRTRALQGIRAYSKMETPTPKRSIAMINLWTSGDEVTSSTGVDAI